MANVKSGGFLRDSTTGALVITGNDFNAASRGDVESLDRQTLAFSGAGGAGIASGDVQATRAVCLRAGTYGQIQVRVSSQAITACTDFRCGVWGSDGQTKLS